MAGTGSVASKRSSVYHTAQSSSPDGVSNSPLTFWTPAPTRAAVSRIDEEDEDSDDDTPRATAFQQALSAKDTMPGSSPMLHRYIDQYASQQDTPSASAEATSETPRTRLQARLLASKGSSPSISTSVSPAPNSHKNQPSSSKLSTPRPISPLVKQNMLVEVTPQSITYQSKVKNSVDEVVKSLSRRGRAKEGLALQALYNQSFKDAGTAELLDALLRQRANDRQKRDFTRYVEDVSKLGSQLNTDQSSSQQLLAEEQGMDENAEVVSEVLPPDYVRPPSPRVVIEVPAQESSQRVTVTQHTQILVPPPTHEGDIMQGVERDTTQSATSSTISPVQQSFRVVETMADVVTSETLPDDTEAATGQPSSISPLEPNEFKFSHLEANAKQDRRPVESNHNKVKPRVKTGLRDASFESGLKKFTPEFQLSQSKDRRRRKQKKRLFAAANGPVFSRAFIMP